TPATGSLRIPRYVMRGMCRVGANPSAPYPCGLWFDSVSEDRIRTWRLDCDLPEILRQPAGVSACWSAIVGDQQRVSEMDAGHEFPSLQRIRQCQRDRARTSLSEA